MVPTKPDLTATGSFSEFKASAFNFKSLRTTSPEKQEISPLTSKNYFIMEIVKS